MNGQLQILLNNLSVIGNLDSPETMLLVHGFGTDQTVWDLITPAFEHRYKIILLDNMGAGESVRSAFKQHKYLTLSGYVEDLKHIISELSLQNITMIGHSVGAMIAALTTLEFPRLFKRLVMIGASPCYRDRDDYFGGFEKETIDQIYDSVMSDFDHWVNSFTQAAFDYHHDSNIAKRFASTLHSYDKKYILTVLCSIFQTDYRSILPKITTPTLLVQSEHDFFVPFAVAEYMHMNIPLNQLVEIPAKGHFPHLTNANELIREIEKFLTNPMPSSNIFKSE